MSTALTDGNAVSALLTALTQLEAAEVCGCPVGTIRSRVARARDDLLNAANRDDQVG